MKAQIEINIRQLKLLRWCMSVASSTLANQSGSGVPAQNAVKVINQIQLLEEDLYEQVEPQLNIEEVKVDPAVQLKLF